MFIALARLLVVLRFVVCLRVRSTVAVYCVAWPVLVAVVGSRCRVALSSARMSLSPGSVLLCLDRPFEMVESLRTGQMSAWSLGARSFLSRSNK